MEDDTRPLSLELNPSRRGMGGRMRVTRRNLLYDPLIIPSTSAIRLSINEKHRLFRGSCCAIDEMRRGTNQKKRTKGQRRT